ncbi:MAG: chromosome segregation protein SMC [Firmicutes bacterium]|nr:chromosome segregation protein SMC [Bacillota bacterium]
MALLKRLEIQGFKSFADKLDLEFGPGVTVVVGPNGCGKSNITDAIRWVLGEQNARSLRGERMEDIIFSGSDRRRPVGMAEVSLTIDNATGFLPVEFSEVRVTRRLYRSGESEFLINKTPCRLRDIQELFMDTGLGRGALAIIGQGKIEEVLNSKPEDKRLMLEEVAGITKYRFRKKEAMRKLEETERSLLRIGDIIRELENQLEPLRIQAEQARRYKQCRERIKELEINLWTHDLEKLQRDWEMVEAQLVAWRKEAAEQEKLVTGLESSVSEYRRDLQAQDQQISEQQQKVHQLSQQRERCEASIRLAEERWQNITDQAYALTEEIEELTNRLAQLKEEYGLEEGKVARLKEELAKWERELTCLEVDLRQAEAEVVAGEASLEDGKSELIEILNALGSCRHELKQVAFNRENRVRKLAELQKARDNFFFQKQEWEKRIAQEEARLNQGQTQVAALERQRTALEGRKAEVTKRGQAEQQVMRKLKEQLQSTRSRLRVLQEMEQDFEGYNRSVREVLRSQKRGEPLTQGVCGAVAELIKVPAGLEKAIEVALGGALQYLVTENDQVANRVIQLLKARNWGRATFLPLNTLTVKPSIINLKQTGAGFLGRAADLVAFESRYQIVAEFLLGRVLVVENLEQALELARQTKFTWKVVTTAGEVVHPGGSITGGSQPLRDSTLLGRKQELAELKKLVDNLELEVLAGQEREKKTEHELNELDEQLNRIQERIHTWQIELAERQRDVLYQREELRKLMQRGDVLTYEEYDIKEQVQKDDQHQKELSQKITELEYQQVQLEHQIASTQQYLKDKRRLVQELQARIMAAKVDMTALDRELQGLLRSLERYWQTQKEYEQDHLVKQRRLLELKQKQVSLQEVITQEQVRLAQIMEAEQNAREKLRFFHTQRTELASQLAQAEEEWRDGQKHLTDLRSQIHQAELKAGRLEMEIQSNLQRIMENYGLTFEQALANQTELVNRRETVEEIATRRDELAAMGEVYLGAIEEYQRLNERLDFLRNQRVDLEEAKQALYQVISEMDSLMIKKFTETFNEVNAHFNDVFQELFGGGRAELRLAEHQNILESGVEIIAQPLGKKLQQLSLLSGGERALTAIALLFAILRTRPSPFCVLDEIEAALDEINGERFAQFLTEYAHQTQFLVISHRKRTIEAGDVLYGVTMGDNGVSKLVSVRLADVLEKVS